jgi:hypothetical protein
MNWQGCRRFGSRTFDERMTFHICQVCQKESLEIFLDCAKKSDELFEGMDEILNTSVLVDSEGKTFQRLEIIEKEDPMTDEQVNQEETKEEPKKKRVVTGGVIKVVKDMLAEGKSDKEIMKHIIELGQNDGKTPRQAKHNAQSAIFNAKKAMKKVQ